eukprot:5854354-Ditylum_brightwellii.AAC.1
MKADRYPRVRGCLEKSRAKTTQPPPNTKEGGSGTKGTTSKHTASAAILNHFLHPIVLVLLAL